MSAYDEPRDSGHGLTTQLIFGLLFGNVVAILGVLAFRPFSGPVSLDERAALELTVGVMSLAAAGLLFLASATRRRAISWWAIAIALNVMQIGRLVPATMAISTWSDAGEIAGLFWIFLFVPFLGVLSAVGVVMTVREMRRGRRRRLLRAA